MKCLKLLSASLLLLCVLCACDSGGNMIKYDISETVNNLDPQFATSATARMIIGNIYEGLVVQLGSGEVAPGAAQSYSISDGGLTYTFTLRDGACWADGAPVTSSDFIFTFQRLFNSSSPSPFASDYLCMENAAEVLQGLQPISALGIEAPDERTVTFRLEYESPFFLELLAATPAMPCNREFFDNAWGRYGLERKHTYTNGPFVLNQWDNTRYILLRMSENYISEKPVIADGVNLYIGRENPMERFLDGNADLVVVPQESISDLPGGAKLERFDRATWCLVFNQADPVLGSALIRQSLSHAVDEQRLGERLPVGLTVTRSFVPGAMLLSDEKYRDLAGDQSFPQFDTQRAEYLFSLGMDSLELKNLPELTMLVPDTNNDSYYMSQVQQDWQQYLGAFVDIEAMSPGQIQSSFYSQSYQILLMPFSPGSGHIHSLLDAFTSTSPQNYTGYRNLRYDSILLDAVDESTVDQAADKYFQAESLLLSDAVVLPLYSEATSYAMARDVDGIDIFPYSGRIYFKYALKS